MQFKAHGTVQAIKVLSSPHLAPACSMPGYHVTHMSMRRGCVQLVLELTAQAAQQAQQQQQQLLLNLSSPDFWIDACQLPAPGAEESSMLFQVWCAWTTMPTKCTSDHPLYTS